MAQTPPAMRKRPRQARSQVTVEAILEAASQVLASSGEDEVTTASVAKRAGVSIGTVYQYFPNRDVILLELARRDTRTIERLMKEAESGDEGLRTFVREVVKIYRRRAGARRQFAMIHEAGHEVPGLANAPHLPDVVKEIWSERGWAGSPARDGVRATVLVRAVGGALQAAALGEADMLNDPRLEDDLMDLIKSLFRIGPQAADAPPTEDHGPTDRDGHDGTQDGEASS